MGPRPRPPPDLMDPGLPRPRLRQASPPARIRRPEADPSTPAVPAPPHRAASPEFAAPPLPSCLHAVLVQAENERTLSLPCSTTGTAPSRCLFASALCCRGRMET
ncbi:hypothetical protein ACQJBY_054154 [Aegilops geniculata]